MALQWLRTFVACNEVRKDIFGKGPNLPAPLDIQWQKCFQLRGASPTWPPDQGLCPQTPVIGSCSALAMVPPQPLTPSAAYGNRLGLSLLIVLWPTCSRCAVGLLVNIFSGSSKWVETKRCTENMLANITEFTSGAIGRPIIIVQAFEPVFGCSLRLGLSVDLWLYRRCKREMPSDKGNV